MLDTFKESPRGVLVSLEEDPYAGYLYHIWFPYTRLNIATVLEGNFVAVKNFAGLEGPPKYSILELASVLPVHYALGESVSDTRRAYPGFVVEAAKAARLDWEQEEPLEQTTKIRSIAIGTGFQIAFDRDPFIIAADESMPMIGEEAFLLTNEATNRVVNRNLLTEAVPHIDPCWLVQNREINVCISTEDLLRTHFGIFGFTGSGKSNLLSTLVAHLSTTENLKIVLFDLMLEYSALLIDKLSQMDNAFVLSLNLESLPGGYVQEEVLRGAGDTQRSAENIARTLLLPKELAPYRSNYITAFENLIHENKFRVYDPSGGALTADVVYRELQDDLSGALYSAERPIKEWLRPLENMGSSTITQGQIQALIDQVEEFLEDDSIPESFESHEEVTATGPISTTLSGEPIRGSEKRVGFSKTVRGKLLSVRDTLRSFMVSEDETPIDEELRLSINELVDILNDRDDQALIVVQSNRDDELREFSSTLVYSIFNRRRLLGWNTPQVLFIYDEADEFMPREPPADSYRASRSAITTLARRGRKFGLGVSFATQRVAYLDTSIIAQAHTHMISKLPRQYDREVVSQAFGLSEDMLRRTLKFSKGQWLLVSYEATGLENVPMPVQFPNANDRIKAFLG